ncbi:hypothetical protein PMZ80_006830 [Knufia obscura]|uniref:Uncharacterized protein n=2 Tax=Knufia TaxID=430999 RepID=A0AAN8FF69_9EURO|nr:hypothetical protein PMZ80_006830 [Knufia obscura]KAK5957371.1 hypothetical protein OHC33_001744 [Knufia fluminis]
MSTSRGKANKASSAAQLQNAPQSRATAPLRGVIDLTNDDNDESNVLPTTSQHLAANKEPGPKRTKNWKKNDTPKSAAVQEAEAAVRRLGDFRSAFRSLFSPFAIGVAAMENAPSLGVPLSPRSSSPRPTYTTESHPSQAKQHSRSSAVPRSIPRPQDASTSLTRSEQATDRTNPSSARESASSPILQDVQPVHIEQDLAEDEDTNSVDTDALSEAAFRAMSTNVRPRVMSTSVLYPASAQAANVGSLTVDVAVPTSTPVSNIADSNNKPTFERENDNVIAIHGAFGEGSTTAYNTFVPTEDTPLALVALHDKTKTIQRLEQRVRELEEEGHRKEARICAQQARIDAAVKNLTTIG